jgi:hypothetical protein
MLLQNNIIKKYLTTLEEEQTRKSWNAIRPIS